MIEYTVKVGSDGYESWWLNGQLHRVDGPAVEYSNGGKAWYLNGKYHRVDGPAVECSDGSEFWYLNGKYHRVDGPAVEYADGYKAWYLNGREVTEEQVLNNTSCHGKVVEIDGKKYKLEEV